MIGLLSSTATITSPVSVLTGFSTGYVKVTNSKWHVTDCKMYQLKKERIQLCALFLDQLLKNEEMFL
ncbi:hypothetical protein F6O57_09690 [Streptococcus suis]|nr:hypothetical protein [Streptococcus suis]MBS7925291.1 hypothetical protein [Streptococcus suis]